MQCSSPATFLAVGGDSREGGGVAGLCIIGEGVISAVFAGLCTVMVAVLIFNVCGAGGGVSFSGVVWRHRSDVWLERAGEATRQQRMQAASCFRSSSCICWSVVTSGG